MVAFTAHEAAALLQRREVSSVELTREVLSRLDALEPRIEAFVTLTPELALSQAEDADRRRAAGDDSPLLGVPAAIKDVICSEGVLTTCSSRMLASFIPPYS